MLRHVARSGRLLRLCQAAAALQLAPCALAESSAQADSSIRAFGSLTQPFSMCDISKAPPKHQPPAVSKPASAPRHANGQDPQKKRAYTTLEDEEDRYGGVLYPEPSAKIGRPAPPFTAEGALNIDLHMGMISMVAMA